MIEENELKINVVLVPDSERLDKMPQYFGKNFLLCESLIYTYMEKLCSSYPGGYWNFYEISNEGFFIAPSNNDNSLNLVWGNNYFDGVMGQEAAGIVACLHIIIWLQSMRVISLQICINCFWNIHGVIPKDLLLPKQ